MDAINSNEINELEGGVKKRKAKKSIAKTPKQIKDLATRIVKGDRITDIAKTLDVPPSTIYRALERSEVKAVIDMQSQRLIQAIPQAVDNVVKLVNDFDKMSDKDDRRIGWEATKKVLESPGLLSGGNMSVQVGQVIMNQQNNTISPVVMDILRKSMGLGGEEKEEEKNPTPAQELIDIPEGDVV